MDARSRTRCLRTDIVAFRGVERVPPSADIVPFGARRSEGCLDHGGHGKIGSTPKRDGKAKTGHAGLSASARATGPHREFNKYLGAPKTQSDVELRRGCRRIEIKQFLSATSRETRFSGTACLRRFIALVCYYRPRLSPTSDTHIGLLSPPFSASATSWRLLGHQQAQF